MFYQRIKSHKTVIQIMMLTILCILTINFHTVSFSHSKYYKDGKLEYNSKFLRITKQEISSTFSLSPASSYENIIVSFQFQRNTILRSNEQETYTISVPSACSITSIKDEGEVKGVVDLANKTITYQGNAPAKIMVSLNCNVRSVINSNDIEIPVSVQEKVEGDIAGFTYASGSYSQDAREYLDARMPASKKLHVSKGATDIYQELISMLQKSYFPTYVDKIYSPEWSWNIKHAIMGEQLDGTAGYITALKGMNTTNIKNYKNVLPGITIDDTSDSLYYIFEIQDNFIGYALTYQQDPEYEYMYFDYNPDNDIDTNKKFIMQWWSEYVSKIYSEEDQQLISDYLKDKDIATYILSGGDIYGLKREADHQLIRIDIRQFIGCILNYNKSPIIITRGTGAEMYNQFINTLKRYAISENMIKTIDDTYAIYFAIIRNETNADLLFDFEHFFLIESKKEDGTLEYAVLKIFSEAGDNPTFARIDMIDLNGVNLQKIKTEMGFIKVRLELSEDTPENRELLTSVATEIANYLEIDTSSLAIKADEEQVGKIFIEIEASSTSTPDVTYDFAQGM